MGGYLERQHGRTMTEGRYQNGRNGADSISNGKVQH
jgi:hypothetical protein